MDFNKGSTSGAVAELGIQVCWCKHSAGIHNLTHKYKNCKINAIQKIK
jgi:hypothetical protein